jgi:hypothetical protein
MVELGHSRVDLLKLDIEGAEYEVLIDLAKGSIRPLVLCIEFERLGLRENYRALHALAQCGYRVVCVEKRNLTLCLDG